MTAQDAPPALRRRRSSRTTATRWGIGVVGVLLVAVLWEAYKLLGPVEGLSIGDTRVLPRTTDLAMPHVWDMVGRLIAPVSRAEGAAPLWVVIATALLTT
ncbi:MAG: ABC transporter permease, partial [Actinomycetota bacterium]|nr:ABC transporter permease [Actinomycetota bacterium]